MAKKAKRDNSAIIVTPSTPETVAITYDVFDLPTSQHKAGLAGLLLQIDSMKNRKKLAPDYVWDDGHPNTKVVVHYTQETVRSLFDDLYDATLAPGEPREKPFTKGKGAGKTEVPWIARVPYTKKDKKGNEKTVEGYVYMELTPTLSTLHHYLPVEGEWVRAIAR